MSAMLFGACDTYRNFSTTILGNAIRGIIEFAIVNDVVVSAGVCRCH